ncbi:Ig-like domain-containing protein [Arthrobacter sp. CJ23]|uniref:Ig-like domain-containing protein n=1 Tax=Arthrobacter sp. CJ23 TaxID=2972479 RepID=UPI00215BECC1|nr:Ig-like domain-containing protein [Arthrobacter sp. CJ23]UVJ40756.1 Ig-like domain-containing protein [Arthrobacter sp. CJ23]
MNQELRQRLLADAAVQVRKHPADLESAVVEGLARARRRFLITCAVALAAALLVTAGLVALRLLLAPLAPVTLASIAVAGPPQAQAQALRPEASIALTATGTYSDGSSRRLDSGVSWASSNQDVAKISPAGVVTAVAPGDASLTATLGGVSGSLVLAVLAPDGGQLAALQVNPGEASMDSGGRLQLLAEGTFSDGSLGTLNASALWASSNPGIAAVDGNGLVTAATPGTATISAAQAGLQGVSVITVTVPPAAKPTALSIDPGKLTLKEKQSAQLTAVATYSDGTSGTVTNVTWGTVPVQSKVATVDASGLLTAHSLGTVTMTAAMAGADGQQLRAQASLTVEHSVKSIVVSPAGPLQLEPGASVQLTATVFYSDGTKGTSVTWASSRPIFASVSQSGVVKGSFQGSTTVTASADGVSSNPVGVAVGNVAPDPGPVKQ